MKMDRKRTFLNIPNAAGLAGFSTRHFRRIIEEEHIPVHQIGRKFFILSADFERWQSTHDNVIRPPEIVAESVWGVSRIVRRRKLKTAGRVSPAISE